MNRVIKTLIAAGLVWAAGVTDSGLVWADADAQFFKVSEEWNTRFRFAGYRDGAPAPGSGAGFFEDEPVGPRVPKGAVGKFFKSEPDPQDLLFQPPPPIRVSTQALRAANFAPIEIEQYQVVILEADRIERYLATDTSRLEFIQTSPTELQIRGAVPGPTFLHVWDVEGRITQKIQVNQPARLQQLVKEQLSEDETGVAQADPFRIQYSNTRNASYGGDNFETIRQASMSFSQAFLMTGDTPYGDLRSGFDLRRSEDKGNGELSRIFMSLNNAHIGLLENFDLHLADRSIEPELLSLPSVRIRGVDFEYRDPAARGDRWSVFYGRELASTLGTISPSLGLNEDIDSWLGGFVHQHHWSEKADWKWAYFQGYGQERIDDLNNRAVELVQRYEILPDNQVIFDLAYDQEHFGWTGAWKHLGENERVTAEYRDISKKFFTMIGNAAEQGEQGVQVETSYRLFQPLQISYDTDIFRDRLFFMEGESDRYNFLQRWSGEYRLSPTQSIDAHRRDDSNAALSAPFRDKQWDVFYRDRLQLLGLKLGLYAGYENRDFENLTSPVLNYRNDKVSAGLNALLPWNLRFAFGQDVSLLEETEARSTSHPRVSSYSLSGYGDIRKTPVGYDWSIRYRDEEETESVRSFLAGEDRLEFSGGLRYVIKEMEFFLDGRYEFIHGESRANEPYRVEADITTGVRYLFDTHVAWETKTVYRGVVFEDENSDGQRQLSEKGLGGIHVWAGGQELVTGEDGNFVTPAMVGKSVLLYVDGASLPSGYSGSTSLRRRMTAQEASRPMLFGLTIQSHISGMVFNDLNLNNLRDEGDRSVKGAKVILSDGQSTGCDDRGRFRFAKVSPGLYDLKLDVPGLPVGYLPSGSPIKKIDLQRGSNFQVLFPVRAERTVSGRVFEDGNGNGIFEEGERPVAGAKVGLGARTSVTDGEGYFLFERLPAESFELKIISHDEAALKTGAPATVELGEKPQTVKTDLPLTKNT